MEKKRYQRFEAGPNAFITLILAFFQFSGGGYNGFIDYRLSNLL